MQPTNDDLQRSEPTAGWLPSDTGNWADPNATPAGPGVTVTKARPWLTAIVSVVTLLILIAALGNQWVTDSIARHANAGTFGDHMAHSVNVYVWRFSSPAGGDVAHAWVANLANVGAILILTFLLVPVVCRGRGGFWQTFFGAWFTVVAATLLGSYVRAGIFDQRAFAGYSGQGKADDILFSSLSPGPATAFAGLAFGLVVGLAAGITAVLSRRTEVIAAPVTPTFGAPWTRDAEPDRPWQPAPLPGPTASPSPWSGSDTDRTPDTSSTTETTPSDSGGEHTAVLPPVDQPAPSQGSAQRSEPQRSEQSSDEVAGDDTQATTQFSRNAPPADDGEQSPRHLEN